MLQLRVSRTVSMGHRLPSYVGLCSSPHGHNLKVEARFGAPRDMFMDFKKLDAALADVLADIDHAMVLEQDDPLLRMLSTMGFRVVALSCEPTTEALASLFYNELSAKGFQVQEVVVFETDKYSASAAAPNFAVRRMP